MQKIKRSIHIICLIGITFIMQSCEDKYLSPESYLNWFANNALYAEHKVEPYIYECKYLPADYMIIKQYEENLEGLTKDVLDKERKERDGFEYFSLRIRSSDGSYNITRQISKSSDDYNNIIQYFSFDIDKDLSLVQGEDTIVCSFSHFERSFGATPYVTFSIGFEKTGANESSNNDKLLIFNDRVFGSGIIKLRIKNSDIKKTPRLKIS